MEACKVLGAFQEEIGKMDIVKAGLGLGKTIRNVGRLKEIVTVFARNGFDEFIASSVLAKIPNFALPQSKINLKEEIQDKDERDIHAIIGKRLRLAFEELGPAFIKIGQLLGSREDLFHSSFIEQMKLLRDKVKGIAFEDAIHEIERSLGRNISDVFESIDKEPIGTASIGVVYKATLKTGEDVVIKVRRPHMAKLIRMDMDIFTFIVGSLENVSEDLRYLGLSKLIEDFSMTLENELNFRYEAQNCKRLKKNLIKHDKDGIIYIPEVFDEFCSEHLLVMEFIKGTAFSSKKILELKQELFPKMERGVGIFLKTFLMDGFFHADLHGGNFFYMDNGRIGLIDFGLMGSLGKKGKISFLSMLYSLMTFNFENLVYEFLDVAEYEKIPDVDSLIRDVRLALNPIVGLSVQQMNMTQTFKLITQTLAKHRIYIPRDWFIVFRAMMTLDGVGKSIGMDLDIFSVMENDVKEIMAKSFGREEMTQELIWAGKDLLTNFKMFPRHFRWFVKDFAKNGYRIEIKHQGIAEEMIVLARPLAFLGLSVLSSALVVCGVAVLDKSQLSFDQIPVLTWIFWSLASFIMMMGLPLAKIPKRK